MIGAVDIGGTKVAAGIVDQSGIVLAKKEFPRYTYLHQNVPIIVVPRPDQFNLDFLYYNFVFENSSSRIGVLAYKHYQSAKPDQERRNCAACNPA